MMEEEQLMAILNNENILKSVNEVPVNFTMATVLEGMVEKQNKDKELRDSLTDALEKVKLDDLPLTDTDLRQKLVKFNSKAMKGFQRIASTLVGITRGEMEGLAINSTRGVNFGEEPNKYLQDRDNEVERQEYIHQISDTRKGLEFLKMEMDTVQKEVSDESESIKENLDKGSIMFQSEIKNLVNATNGYLDILTGETKLLENAMDKLNSAKEEIKDKDTRVWVSDIMDAMSGFGHFVAKFAEAEVDLNKINQIDATGILRSALTTHIGNMMTFDQRMYPDNNQVPIPPNHISPAVVQLYMVAYKDRALELANVGPEGIVSANNKFDRRIANAHNQADRISPTLLLPKPARLTSSDRFLSPKLAKMDERLKGSRLKRKALSLFDQLPKSLAEIKERDIVGAAARARREEAPLPTAPESAEDIVSQALEQNTR